MSRLPDTADLLLTARSVLIEKLIAHLPPSLHYEARMVARVMAIAAREPGVSILDVGPQEADLASAIRAGEHDQGTAFHALLDLTRSKLLISNPDMLACYDHLGI
ncbi:hypothetical protein [Pseudomonas sp. NFACC13-1]|uniref:hypothetical protein n=1 Tax=Pseudomonas sp. NFACC13-1 TaxID=1566245 RepID=UPI000885A542|nr:hypothetical protein [Pseudomonas sp. NFACC13-1]SDB34936.1 hypothetical protein SAMN03159290_02518 [Pseudomonas sp. NFACC13-1]